MNTLEMTLLIWAGSLLAGFLGALTGLGGGVVIVPLLTLVFGVDIRYAIGASLVSVIATSFGRGRGLCQGRLRRTCGSESSLKSPPRWARWRALRWRRGWRHRPWPSRSASCWPSRPIWRAGPAALSSDSSSPTRWPPGCGSMATIPAPMVRSRITSAACPAASA